MKRIYFTRIIYFIVLVGILILGGCRDTDEYYEIEMTRDGQAFKRKLTCWEERDSKASDLNSEDLERISQHYQQQTTSPDGIKSIFVGSFQEETPDDVGGQGWYLCYSSRMGDAFLYSERFLGDDDLEGRLSASIKATDRVVDLLIGWLESELGQDSGFDRLRVFLDETFRQDLQNVALYLWKSRTEARGREVVAEEMIVRIFQYIAERGYFPVEMLSVFAGSEFRGLSGEEDMNPWKVVRRNIAEKMGIPAGEPLPESLYLLADSEYLEESFEKYLLTTDVFQTRIKEWEEKVKTHPEAKRPTPNGMMNDLIEESLGLKFSIWSSSVPVARLSVELACEAEPIATNGTWDNEDRAISWSGDIKIEEGLLPIICYALWSVPASNFQIDHFGSIVLEKSNLMAYCIWHSKIDKKKAEEWDDFVSSLKPGEELEENLASFRFSDAAPEESSWADYPASLILNELK